MTNETTNTTNQVTLIPYQIDGAKILNVTQMNDDVWLTQNQMAELFECSTDNISLHLKNIFETQELSKDSTTEDFSVVQNEGGRTVTRNITHYNLDAIISVGYRVNSKRGIQFRQWATQVIKNQIQQNMQLNSSQVDFQENIDLEQLGYERRKLLNKLLKEKGMTQLQVAKELGFSNVTISNCFKGKHFNIIIEKWINNFLGEAKSHETKFMENLHNNLDNAINGDINEYKKLMAALNSIALINNFDELSGV